MWKSENCPQSIDIIEFIVILMCVYITYGKKREIERSEVFPKKPKVLKPLTLLAFDNVSQKKCVFLLRE
ncbi:MAG: hypothetical protein NC091_05570 [Bacteroides sp.]|nr:hypothetical protein [Bacteroides sp.]